MAHIDLRSDTVTVPTPAMRRAMANAAVGDDVMREDPTVNRLERTAAALLGKEAALFVPSGTFANQCAILTHARSGNEVILAENSHVVQHEAGAAALLARVQLRPASAGSPHLLPQDLLERLREPGDIHYPRTGLVCVEQATSSGTVIPLKVLAEIKSIAGARRVPVHMDGARFFNACEALGVSPRTLARQADSVAFCLSKGLCAPVGSLLLGSRNFIERARANRKRMGGGLRQAGILAAAGLVGLKEVRPGLKNDHAKARLLAELLRKIPGVSVLREPEINMVFAALPLRGAPQKLVTTLNKAGVRIFPPEAGVFRFVTHQQINEAGVRRAATALARALR
ncbi:MAG: DegT/DnrJ/EryC1/StrS family aminotransferase [Elusimicrobia bacterium]|nr:DegT/DnrJ/EryC1/StrS family aminotransferase [Elusimicrobiota bacterium]MDE2313980.1 DegT/DnrJ/EryC1/StrS family aminotransferase [Elusimicrobiota bacterium]